MKTAVQIAVEKLEQFIPAGNQLSIRLILDEALEKEKEQIIDAYKNGYGVSFIDGDNRNFSRPQEYYNQTYGK